MFNKMEKGFNLIPPLFSDPSEWVQRKVQDSVVHLEVEEEIR